MASVRGQKAKKLQRKVAAKSTRTVKGRNKGITAKTPRQDKKKGAAKRRMPTRGRAVSE